MYIYIVIFIYIYIYIYGILTVYVYYVGRLKGSIYLVNTRLDFRNAAHSLQIRGWTSEMLQTVCR